MSESSTWARNPIIDRCNAIAAFGMRCKTCAGSATHRLVTGRWSKSKFLGFGAATSILLVPSLSACERADSDNRVEATANPIAELPREGAAFHIDVRATEDRPIYRLGVQSVASSSQCPFYTLKEKIACNPVSSLSLPNITAEVVRSGASHYQFAGGYGCDSKFCLSDFSDKFMLSESPVVNTILENNEAYFRVGKKEPYAIGILVIRSRNSFSAICFYPDFVESNRNEIVSACKRVAKEG